ncbi:MAG: hypothetical protein ACRCZU_11500, partial [Selenomonadaceae bacterium]
HGAVEEIGCHAAVLFRQMGAQHAGKSMWGLTEWNPPEVKRTHTTSTTTTKTTGTKTKTTSRRREKLLEGIQEEE